MLICSLIHPAQSYFPYSTTFTSHSAHDRVLEMASFSCSSHEANSKRQEISERHILGIVRQMTGHVDSYPIQLEQIPWSGVDLEDELPRKVKKPYTRWQLAGISRTLNLGLEIKLWNVSKSKSVTNREDTVKQSMMLPIMKSVISQNRLCHILTVWFWLTGKVIMLLYKAGRTKKVVSEKINVCTIESAHYMNITGYC